MSKRTPHGTVSEHFMRHNYGASGFIKKGQTMEQKPSIGRIVIYNHPGSADGKYLPQQSPAIIQHVNEDGSCRLFVFGPKGQHMDDSLKQGDGPCQWNWPPRV